jgi:hypothetical protein
LNALARLFRHSSFINHHSLPAPHSLAASSSRTPDRPSELPGGGPYNRAVAEPGAAPDPPQPIPVEHALEYARGTEFDTGRFAAIYLRALGALDIVSMIVGWAFFDGCYLDLSFLFMFWAANALEQHSAVARRWVLGIGGLTLAISLFGLAYAAIHGTSGMTIRLGLKQIKDPPLWQVIGGGVAGISVEAVPLLVLLSPRARRQFNARQPDGAQTGVPD